MRQQSFQRPHPVIRALRETPDHTLSELIRSHRVTEDAFLDNTSASTTLQAWHLELGRLLRAELTARAGGNPPEDVHKLVTTAGRLSNAEVSSVLGYLKEYADIQEGPLRRFAQTLFVEVFASLLDYGQANQTPLTYN